MCSEKKKKKQRIWDHSSLQYLSRVLGPLLCYLLLGSTHRLSMGFRSGDWDGHGRRFILYSVNLFCVDLYIRFGPLSCWRSNEDPGPDGQTSAWCVTGLWHPKLSLRHRYISTECWRCWNSIEVWKTYFSYTQNKMFNCKYKSSNKEP